MLKSCFHALSPVQMPSQAANITSGHEVIINHNVAGICGRLEDYTKLGSKRQLAPARCPKGCPAAKTLCMAEDCHKTWYCSAMAKLPSSFGVFVQLSTVASN
eukprot:4026519-Amphidinium_carterae.1